MANIKLAVIQQGYAKIIKLIKGNKNKVFGTQLWNYKKKILRLFLLLVGKSQMLINTSISYRIFM